MSDITDLMVCPKRDECTIHCKPHPFDDACEKRTEHCPECVPYVPTAERAA